jgi:hypothetical protein
VTNTLDQNAADESIGYGDMNFEYDFDNTVEWLRPVIVDIDDEIEDPTGLWENNCDDWTERECQGNYYWGGKQQCGKDHSVWRDVDMSRYSGVQSVNFKGKFWAVDSWDGERATVQMIDQNGNVLDEWAQDLRLGQHDTMFTGGQC